MTGLQNCPKIVKNEECFMSPRFPPLLALPLSRVPPRLSGGALALALEKIFATPLAAGELDFLAGKILAISVSDARLDLALSLKNGRLRAVSGGADVHISGSMYDFLLLASRREDPDTLFFKRRLRLSGDTELGLAIKNFLDSLELEPQFAWLERALGHSVSVYERLAGRK
jgi:O2-independent ubiquinone biosynthesis accessory factor UbiT